MKKDKRKLALKRFASKQDLIFLSSFAVFSIVLPTVVLELLAYLSVINWNPHILPYIELGLGILIFGVFLFVWFSFHQSRNRDVLDFSMTKLLDSSLGRVVDTIATPVIVCDEKGTIYWHNDAVTKIAHSSKDEKLKQGSKLTSQDLNDYIRFGSNLYKTQRLETESEGKKYYYYFLTDKTELFTLEHRYHNEHLAIAYISIDAQDELQQYDSERFHQAMNDVDFKIKTWIEDMKGLLTAMDNGRYLAIFDTEHLENCLKDQFSILDDVRTTRLGDGISVTLSIGVSNIEGTIENAEKAAQGALDMALQRGGDQVVYKTNDGVEFFGGRTKAIYKRSNVKARILCAQLVSYISASSNVLIMGHKGADFDAFGSCVGLAKIVYNCNVPFKIVADENDENLSDCFTLAYQVPYLKNAFISARDAKDLVKRDTLVIISDVNNLAICEAPEVTRKTTKLVVIDHHIKKEDLPDTTIMDYIETTASSASELVTEFLEFGNNNFELEDEIANLLLSGILLDTKQFSRNTGTRTFSAAQYLRAHGANIVTSTDLFKTNFEEIAKESKILSSVTMYGNDVAIASCDGENDASFRVIASKAADKMLTIKNVEASFTLVKIRNTIYISGRSNGFINVQLILEQLGGGGHYDMAGAQVAYQDMRDVISKLKTSIDSYKKSSEKGE